MQIILNNPIAIYLFYLFIQYFCTKLTLGKILWENWR